MHRHFDVGRKWTPVRIAFPLDYRERLFPNLFTDAEILAPEPPSTGFR